MFSLGIFAVCIQRQDVINVMITHCNMYYKIKDVERGPQAVGSTSSLRKRGMINRKSATGVLTQVYESSEEKNLE